MPIQPRKKYHEYEFYYSEYIEEELKELGYKDSDINRLARQLVNHVEATPSRLKGDVIKKTGGAVKLRISPKESVKGVQGEDRIIYCYLNKSKFFFLAVYVKSEKTDLTNEEIKDIRNAVIALKKQFKGESK